ncbi:hypothetical protein UFRH6_123 [Pseudomonas phage UF_RH6]|nr:hypothetical protein UFRH6_123 [Pseudomonas phage UF_RH6]
MNKTIEVGKSLWEVVCSSVSALVAAGLLMMFVYWMILQPAPLSINSEGLELNYKAARGTLMYVENPISPPNTSIQVELSAELIGVDNSSRYLMSSRDSRDMIVIDDADLRPANVRIGYPLYGVYIPPYVKPGTYHYEVEARYRLNFFREEKLKLPTITITVE